MSTNVIYGTHYIIENLPLPLYHGDKAVQGFSKELLDIGAKIFIDYHQAHTKIFFFTVTLTFPVNDPLYSNDNSRINSFCPMLMQTLSRSGYDPAYLWVREKDTSSHHHYHLALWLNGSVVQHPQKVIDQILKWWSSSIGDYSGCVHYQSAFQYAEMLRRHEADNKERLFRAYQSFSYLAKLYSKEWQLPKGCRHYGYSKTKYMEQYAFLPNWKVPSIEE